MLLPRTPVSVLAQDARDAPTSQHGCHGLLSSKADAISLLLSMVACRSKYYSKDACDIYIHLSTNPLILPQLRLGPLSVPTVSEVWDCEMTL